MLAAVKGVVALQRFEHSAKIRGLQVIEEGCQLLLVFGKEHQVIAFFEKRNEIQAVLGGSRLEAKGGICFAGLHDRGGLAVGIDLAIVAPDLRRADVKAIQFAVQPESRSRTEIPIDKKGLTARQIRHVPNGLGIARRQYQPLGAVRQRNHLHCPVGEEMLHKGRVVLTARIQEVGAGKLAQSLPKMDEAIQGTDRQAQQVNVGGEMRGYRLQSQVMASGEDSNALPALWKDHLLKQESTRARGVQLLGDGARGSDLGEFHKPRVLEGLEMMANPGRGVPEGLGELRQRAGMIHEQPQDRHTARVGQELDLLEGVKRFDRSHGD